MTQVRVIARDSRDLLGEGVTWAPGLGMVLWVDILGHRLWGLHLASGAIRHWDVGEMIGWVIERRAAPGLIAGLETGFARIDLDPFSITPIAAPEPGIAENRLNDATADRWGRIFAGTMHRTGALASGSLYRLDPDHAVTRVDSGYRIANGPAISACGSWLYHTDSAQGVVYRFALHAPGEGPASGLGPREEFVRFPDDWGAPDGMAADAEGGLWIAHWGGGCISRFSADGRRERVIDLPASQITRMAFAGENLDRLFVTSAADGVDELLAGSLFEVDAGVRGIAPNRFGG